MFAAHTFITLLRRQNPSSLHRLHSISPKPLSSPNSLNSVDSESNPINSVHPNNPLDIAFHKAIRNFRQHLITNKKKSDLISESEQQVERSDDDQNQRLRSVDFKQMLEISPELVMFMRGLDYRGYLNAENLSPLDLSCFLSSDDPSPRWRLRVSAWRFGMENRQIARYLSKTDVKKLVLFGCPSTSLKSVNPAKRLRAYFGIQENTVCNSCKLNTTCRYNSRPWRKQVYHLQLPDVMKITVSYALELVAPELTVPNSVKYSTNKLLGQVAQCMS